MIPSNETVPLEIKLRKAAEEIASLNWQFGTAVQKLYDEIEQIKYSKQHRGINLEKFVSEIEGYKDDFIQLELLMKEYEDVCILVSENLVGITESEPNLQELSHLL